MLHCQKFNEYILNNYSYVQTYIIHGHNTMAAVQIVLNVNNKVHRHVIYRETDDLPALVPAPAPLSLQIPLPPPPYGSDSTI